MPAVNFKGRFAPKVALHTKRTTVRAGARFRVGDRFYGYYGMRTKHCVKLCEGWVTHADEIVVAADAVTVAGRKLPAGSLTALALGDGFDSVAAFRAFFAETYELPFTGQLVQWVPDTLLPKEQKAVLARLDAALMGAGKGGGK